MPIAISLRHVDRDPGHHRRFVPVGFAQSSAASTPSRSRVVGIALLLPVRRDGIRPLIAWCCYGHQRSIQADKPSRVTQLYRGFLTLAMRARWVTIAVTVGAFIASLVALGQVPRQFFPASDPARTPGRSPAAAERLDPCDRTARQSLRAVSAR